MSGLISRAVARLVAAMAAATGAALMGFSQVGGIFRWVLDKLRDKHSIADYASLSAAFAALGGAEGSGYGAAPVELDLLGRDIVFTGTLYVPINVSLVNGRVTSAAGTLVFRNPFMANTALRGYTLYWQYMTCKNRNVAFNCKTTISGYIGGAWADCDFTGPNAALVMVNSNALWTEYNTFTRCTFAANAATGAAILFDGNVDGNSANSVGAGAGAPDGSFGYNSYAQCKTDSTAPRVGINLINGATWYNGGAEFRGYARGAGPSGAFLYIQNGATVSYCDFRVHLESFGAASNIISVEDGGRLWNNTGSIQSASPEMTFSQGGAASIRTNSILVTGAVLVDKSGAAIFQGDQAQSMLVNHTLQRLSYVKNEIEYADKLQAGTSVVAPTIAATLSLESNVQYTGMLTSRPNDMRSTASRNWAWLANLSAFGNYVLMESTTNTGDPATARLEIKSGGACYNSTGTWGTISDATLKTHVATARPYLDDLRRVRIVKYSMIADNMDKANMLGVLAQELETIFPGMVDTSVNPDTGDETKQVKTSVLTYMLVSAVQELAAKVDALNRE